MAALHALFGRSTSMYLCAQPLPVLNQNSRPNFSQNGRPLVDKLACLYAKQSSLEYLEKHPSFSRLICLTCAFTIVVLVFGLAL
jgi:hypothetical protein